MRLSLRTPSVILLLSGWSLIAYGQTAPTTQPSHGWWNQPFAGRPQGNPDGKTLPLIRVQKNHFVDPDGNIVLFRGVSISDPDKIEHDGHWNKQHFQHIRDMGATIVRIPVHPIAWRTRGPQQYLRLLDQAVRWCTDLHMYVIIDWHSIGNLKMELFQNPMYDTTQRETYEFWRTIARHFHGDNTVAFYELFNEPTTAGGKLGSVTWTDWKQINENIIRLIRAYNAEGIPLVAGFDWAYDLTPLREDPIAAEGIGYVTHPYANKRPKPWEPKWEEDFGFAAARYPIIATEIGFGLRDGEKMNPDDYGNRIVNYLAGQGNQLGRMGLRSAVGSAPAQIMELRPHRQRGILQAGHAPRCGATEVTIA